jgi:hypothetical protein
MVITLSLSLLAHVAVYRLLFSHEVAADCDARGAGFVRFATNWTPFLLGEAALFLVILFLSLESAFLCVLRRPPLHRLRFLR